MNCSSLLFVALLFSAASLVYASPHSTETDNPGLHGLPEEENFGLPVEQNLTPGVLEKLMDLIKAGDHPDAITQMLEVSPLGFSKESDQVLKAMIEHDRPESFVYLFGALEKESKLRGMAIPCEPYFKYRAHLFKAALYAHRPQICTFAIQPFSKISKETATAFWNREPLLWTVEELLELFPSDSSFAYGMLASADVLRRCKTLNACRLPLEFNFKVMTPSPDGYDRSDYTEMLRALLENQALDDADMAALIEMFTGKIKMEDETVEEFSRARPNYPLSRQAFIACLHDDAYSEYPDHILEGLFRLSYDQFERLRPIVAAGDSPQEVINVAGYSRFALGKRLFEILAEMLRLDRVASFKALFSMVDFENFKASETMDVLLTLIYASHALQRTELFEYLVKCPYFRPDLFAASKEVFARFGSFGAAELNKFTDILERMVDFNDKVLGEGLLLSSATFNLLRNFNVSDDEMTALLGRLYNMGAFFEEAMVDVLQQFHPDYDSSRQFLVDRLPDVKEPDGYI